MLMTFLLNNTATINKFITTNFGGNWCMTPLLSNTTRTNNSLPQIFSVDDFAP